EGRRLRDLSGAIASRCDKRPVPLGVPLLDPRAMIVSDIEAPRRIYRDRQPSRHLAEACAKSGDHRPVSLGIPLLDPRAVGIVRDIEVAPGIQRQGAGIPDLARALATVCAGGGGYRPVPLGVSLLDPMAPVCNIEVTC